MLIPVIVPTAITVAWAVCTYLFWNAVDTQENDSKLSKVAKGVARILICTAAAAILIPCIILNLITSLIPLLIFRAINKDIFSQKDIEKGEAQTVNKIEINSGEKYNTCVKEAVNKLGQQDQPLMRSDNQPNIEVISRVVEGKQAIDQTITAKNINNNGIRDGKAMIRTVGNDCSVSMQGIMIGDLCDQQKSFATGFKLQCDLLPKNGLDLQFGMSMRTENTQQEAKQALMQSDSVRTLLSGNHGILSIEHPGSSQHK